MIKNDSTYALITDHLGSVKLVVNTATGVVRQRIDYDEFGNVMLNTNPDFQPPARHHLGGFGYAGGLYDDATKLVRFGARDYSAKEGRWTVIDPILFKGGTSNLYEYCVNDPINYVDIIGLQGMRTSRRGIQFIANFEGFRSTTYIDVAGHPTIGYGHLIKPDENYSQITKQAAYDLLSIDLSEAENAVNNYVSISLSQYEFDALVSFVFNLGAGNFAKSSLLKNVNLGNKDSIEESFLKWNKARINGILTPVKGLTRRRQAESNRFNCGK